MMVLFRQLVVVYLVLISVSVKGETVNGKDDDRLHRSKRNVYPCASTNALKKYQYVSGHTACISASASLDTANSGVTASEQTEIVNQHNTYRGSTAATDMNMMSWDTEVAYIAQKWAENCQTSHDTAYKRRIPGRFALGQNLAWAGGKMTWAAVIKLWYDEITQFTYNSDSNVASQVGHYTQVVWAKSIKIGCGYAKCGSTHLYACNYGPPGNFNVKTPYTQGTKCGSCSGNCLNDLCNCDLVCLNGGTLNLATCTCSCISGFTGTDCSLDCATKTDPSYCVSSYTVTNCPVFSNVPDECPNMCSFCPNSGIAITGATDGKGVVPFDLTGSGPDTTTVADTGSDTTTVADTGSDTTTVADTGTTNDPGSETTDIVTTAATTLNGVSNSNGVVTTDITGGGTTDVTTQNSVSNSNHMTSTGMTGGGTTDGATQTGTEDTSVSVTDVTNTEPTGGVSDNSKCICLLVGSIILSVSLYVMSK